MKTYNVSEILKTTIQGEGLHAGWPCVFLRLSGCNYWPDPKVPSRVCPWCDTKQLHNSVEMTLPQILKALFHRRDLGVVVTGGEPALQADDALMSALVSRYAWCDFETNASVPLQFDRRHHNLFISASPKTLPAVDAGVVPNWYKLVYPAKADLLPVLRTRARALGIPVYIQPQEPQPFDQEKYTENINACVALVMDNPELRLSLQLHKILRVP
jgi:7-carboxy-7-deazaguanine synthase